MPLQRPHVQGPEFRPRQPDPALDCSLSFFDLPCPKWHMVSRPESPEQEELAEWQTDPPACSAHTSTAPRYTSAPLGWFQQEWDHDQKLECNLLRQAALRRDNHRRGKNSFSESLHWNKSKDAKISSHAKAGIHSRPYGVRRASPSLKLIQRSNGFELVKQNDWHRHGTEGNFLSHLRCGFQGGLEPIWLRSDAACSDRKPSHLFHLIRAVSTCRMHYPYIHKSLHSKPESPFQHGLPGSLLSSVDLSIA